MTERLIEKLVTKINGVLPGKKAQEIMAPNIRYVGDKYPDRSNSTPSGVLILLYPNNGEWYTVFIERTTFGPHGGQISLPGGKKEDYDSDITVTALREAEEEIGINQTKIHVIGELTTLYVPHSNFSITPVVGFQNEIPVLKQNDLEVQSIINISFKELFDIKNKGIKTFNRGSNIIQAPCYNAHGHVVWGATAMIMSEFEVLMDSSSGISV